MKRRLSAGRLEKNLSKQVLKFLAEENIEWDSKLIDDDIIGCEAHAIMLWNTKILKIMELKEILKVLEKAKKLNRHGKFKLNLEFEDVHLNIEQFLITETGMEIGGKLHTGRSRNDQILLDLRLYLRKEINDISLEVAKVVDIFLNLAKEHLRSVMPGYTHLQHAQPTTLAHWLVAYCSMFIRDLYRLENCLTLINQNPLGACALTGTSWPINREETSKLLGFDEIQENSMDVINSRGEDMYDVFSALSILAVHLSKISEDLMLWNTFEFRMIELNDTYCTGSSIMPQKKNPDVAELVRGKTSYIITQLSFLLSLMKNLPSGYFKDLQETKHSVFRTVETIKRLLFITGGMVLTMKVNKERMLNLSAENFSTATDIADLLTRKMNLPFRLSHEIVGIMVKNVLKDGRKPSQIDLKDLEKATPKTLIDKITISNQELKQILNPLNSVQSKRSLGSPNPKETQRMIRNAEAKLKTILRATFKRKKKIEISEKDLQLLVRKIIKSR